MPLVVLHHSICAFDDWPEYRNVIGGKYFLKAAVIDGVEYPPSGYLHDLKFSVNVVDPRHPVTKGITDFEILDETYSGFYVHPQSQPLLTTDESSSTPVIAWTKKYGKSQVVTIQIGHDANAFANPNYRKLLKQAVVYSMKKSTPAKGQASLFIFK